MRCGHGRRPCADFGLYPAKNDRRPQFGRRRYVLDGCGGSMPTEQTLLSFSDPPDFSMVYPSSRPHASQPLHLIRDQAALNRATFHHMAPKSPASDFSSPHPPFLLLPRHRASIGKKIVFSRTTLKSLFQSPSSGHSPKADHIKTREVRERPLPFAFRPRRCILSLGYPHFYAACSSDHSTRSATNFAKGRISRSMLVLSRAAR